MVPRIAVITSDVFFRRLTPSLAAFVRPDRDFRIINIHRPWSELRRLISDSRPVAVITEWLPGVTRQIVQLGYPTVIADSDRQYPGAVSIDIDDWQVGSTAAQFFLDAGYRHFACLYGLPAPVRPAGELAHYYATQRLEGFTSRLAGFGFNCDAFRLRNPPPESGDYMESWQSHDPRLSEWLQRLPKPVGLFAVHDPLGRLVCETALEAGLRVPDEIAVIGANHDELICGLTYPPLSSVSIPWDRVGALAGKWIEHLLQGGGAPAGPLLVQPGPVVVRQSTSLSAVDDPELRRALHYLREHVATSLTIESLCDTLRLSRRNLERKFSRHLQLTPWQMLCRIRVEEAKRLLVETDLPLALIAEKAGFGDGERFAVVFRREEKMSPGAFRKQARHPTAGPHPLLAQGPEKSPDTAGAKRASPFGNSAKSRTRR